MHKSKNEYDQGYHKRLYAKNKAIIEQLKSAPCLDCGKRYPPWIMEFDHRDPEDKKFNLGGNLCKKLFDEEVAKCDIVCANCHRERTHKQRLEGRLAKKADFNDL